MPNETEVRNIDESRHMVDPIRALEPDFIDSDLAFAAEQEIDAVDAMLANRHNTDFYAKHGSYEKGCNARLDWLYAEGGGANIPMTEFGDYYDDADNFFTRAEANASIYKQHNPADLWDIRMKHLDLKALQAHRNAQDSQTNYRVGNRQTPKGRGSWIGSMDQMKDVISDSVDLMNDMSKRAHGESKVASDARGLLYETLLITYSRLLAWQDEKIDTVFVRSALDREDRPHNHHVLPKRSFDMVINNNGHNEMYQAKDRRDKKPGERGYGKYGFEQYAPEIIKVVDEEFIDTLDDMPKITGAFRVLMSNSKNTPLRKQAQHELDSVFGRQLHEAREHQARDPRFIGHMALAG